MESVGGADQFGVGGVVAFDGECGVDSCFAVEEGFFVEVVYLSEVYGEGVDVELDLGGVVFFWLSEPACCFGGFYFVSYDGGVVVLAEDVESAVDFVVVVFVVGRYLGSEDFDVGSFVEDFCPVVF